MTYYQNVPSIYAVRKKNALLKDFVLDEMGFVLEESFLEKRNASTNRASQVVSHLLS